MYDISVLNICIAEKTPIMQRKNQPHKLDHLKLQEKCDKEDITDSLGVEQPLFIEEQSQTIKCRWCPSWVGSSVVKVANQHTRKAVSHRLARIKELNLPQQAPLGLQTDIRSYLV